MALKMTVEKAHKSILYKNETESINFCLPKGCPYEFVIGA